MQHFLQHFDGDAGVDVARCHTLEQRHRRRLVRMFGAGRVHQDVGVDQDHGSRSAAVG